MKIPSVQSCKGRVQTQHRNHSFFHITRETGDSDEGCGRKNSSHPPPLPNPWKVRVFTLYRKRNIADVIMAKDLEVGRRAYIIQVGPI